VPAAFGRGFPQARLSLLVLGGLFHIFYFLPVPPMVDNRGLIDP